GADIAPLSLQWVPATSEFLLVYADSIAGFNLFPGEVHLRRFAAPGAPSSDTFLSPNANLNLLNAPYPLLFVNGGYIGSISRFVSIAQGGESYLVRVCPLLTSFTADHAVSRSFSPITFRATASGGSPGYSYSWQFGDNASANGAVVQHMYSANGTYTVTLTAMDAAGATAIYKSTVLITDQVRSRAARH
ncbi:MAG TPA: PKD domain-containing protein, partial [Thermoanaerobaculia bacterium]|nr:PKD domain-containing protein [Thermoanaerobaculia bacterium]